MPLNKGYNMVNRIIISTGMALFAMFFGAGNIVYPLTLGTSAGDHVFYAIIAFLITGAGLPFLGLFSMSLYQGNYKAFFSSLGKIPSFLVILFLAFILGPFLAIPRTETITYQTLLPFLSIFHLSNASLFSAIYCSVLFLISYKQNRAIDIICTFLSPIKLTLFFILICSGLMKMQITIQNYQPISVAIREGLSDGYATMDLLCAFFFCTAAYQNILLKVKEHRIENKKINEIFLKSCIFAGLILGTVYIGFILIALGHASYLRHINTVQMIQVISKLILGNFGSLFIGICVLFACISTATALTDVTTQFFYETMFNKKISRTICLIIVLIITFFMTIIGFSGIMNIATPILEIIYPALIVYCILIIVKKLHREKMTKNLT